MEVQAHFKFVVETTRDSQTALVDMHAHAVFLFLCCFLFPRTTRPAPVAHPASTLRDTLERARMLADKIAEQIPAPHAQVSLHATFWHGRVLTFDLSWQTGDLEMMAAALGIPPAPVLKPLAANFDVDTCVSRMSTGVQLFQELLGVLSARLDGLEGLRADLRDLFARITEIHKAIRPGDTQPVPDSAAELASRLHGDYEVQVAAQVTLGRLRSFAHDLIRSLRDIAGHVTAR
ncbi:colony stimulating factor 3 (granulocyte) a isoform X1 [Stigmatopora nigra]